MGRRIGRPNVKLGWELGYSEFIAEGKWNVDDVLRPIYAEAGEVVGREFKYLGDEQELTGAEGERKTLMAGFFGSPLFL